MRISDWSSDVCSSDLRSRRAAGLFAAAGIGAGSSVAVLLPNRIAFIEAMLGAQHIGAYAVPINWHFAPAEIDYILDDCGERVLVTEQHLAAPLGGLLPADIVVFVVDRAVSETARAWEPARVPSATSVSGSDACRVGNGCVSQC